MMSIAQEDPARYQETMDIIYKQMMRHPALKQKHYQRFERNHLTLYSWFLTAEEGKQQMGKYLFAPLLQQAPNFHNQKLNSIMATSRSIQQSNPITARRLKKVRRRAPGEEDENGGFGLFMKTFTACRGESYTPYDYDKHMEGQRGMIGYNSFIRPGHGRNSSAPRTLRVHPWEHFEEWHKHRERASLIPVQNVLSDPRLNSERGLQRKLRRDGSLKVVIRNHQCRPVNYYLKRPKTPRVI